MGTMGRSQSDDESALHDPHDRCCVAYAWTLGLGLDSEVAKLSAEVDAVAKAEMKPAIERLSK